MRPWLKVEPALVKHRKTRILARLWHCHPYQVVGFLVTLWGYCLEYQEDGDVTRMLDEELRDMAAPCLAAAIGTIPDVRAALQEAGFLDADGKLHDWADYTGGLFVTREYDRQRQAGRRKIQAKGSFTADDWRELLILVGFQCSYCGRVRTRLGQEHVVPMSRGGAHDPGNVVTACKACNSRKGNRMLAECGMAVLPEVLALIQPTRFGLPNISNGSPKTSYVEQSRVEESRAEKTTAAALPDVAFLRATLPESYRPSLDGHLRASTNPAGVAASIRAFGPGGIHEKYSWEVIGRALFELAADRDPMFNARRLDVFCRKLVEQPNAGAPRDTVGEQLSRIRA